MAATAGVGFPLVGCTRGVDQNVDTQSQKSGCPGVEKERRRCEEVDSRHSYEYICGGDITSW